MKILAFDSSGMTATVAYLQDEVLVCEYTVNYKKTHSQTLLPMLDEIVQTLGLDLETIDAIAVSKGPGSFTGLRIGSATVKGLALALNKPVIPVSTLDALAFNLCGHQGIVCPIMDARRNQVYTGIYRFEGLDLKTIWEPSAMGIEELIGVLDKIGEPTVFLGDGVPVYRDNIDCAMQTAHTFAPPHLAMQRAGSVASLGAVLASQGVMQTADEHVPEYLRVSQAERERAERIRREGQ